MPMSLIYAIGIFILVMLIVLLIGEVAGGRSGRLKGRLQQYTGTTPAPTPQATHAPGDQLPTVTQFLAKRGFTESLMLELTRAGSKWRPSEFAVAVAACTIIPVFIASVLRTQLLMVVAWGILGFLVPIAILKARQSHRLGLFNGQIADALTIMASSIRSGYSFMRAMQVVANEMPPPISEEFSRVIDECNVGVPTEDALAHLVERVGSYDMELVATAVTIQIQLGGNLAEILETIAETIRERIRINGEIAALTADGRLSGVILVALPIFMGLVIYVLNPSYLAPLIKEQAGRIWLACAGGSMIIGAYIIRKMLIIDF